MQSGLLLKRRDRISPELEAAMLRHLGGAANEKGYFWACPPGKLPERQWVSTRKCIPVEITEIKVRDYLHTVEFSEEAARIQKLLFGEAGCS